jgi:hypothetical protein
LTEFHLLKKKAAKQLLAFSITSKDLDNKYIADAIMHNRADYGLECTDGTSQSV